MSDDRRLLSQYVETGSRKALQELIQRYLGLVYSSALRQVRDPNLAEDVTQAAFLVLTQKARTIRNGVAVGGWLLAVTRCVVVTVMRKQAIQNKHEQCAAKPEVLEAEAVGQEWKEIAPLLDAELNRLGQVDRDALVLRFFQDRSFAEIGVELGFSEEGARKTRRTCTGAPAGPAGRARQAPDQWRFESGDRRLCGAGGAEQPVGGDDRRECRQRRTSLHRAGQGGDQFARMVEDEASGNCRSIGDDRRHGRGGGDAINRAPSGDRGSRIAGRCSAPLLLLLRRQRPSRRQHLSRRQSPRNRPEHGARCPRCTGWPQWSARKRDRPAIGWPGGRLKTHPSTGVKLH